MSNIIKTEIHGAIVDKFVIRPINGSSDAIVMESIGDKKEPAVFNTEEDVQRYLDFMDIDQEERNNIRIDNTNISYFNNGGILVEFEE